MAEKSENVVWHDRQVSRADREARLQQRGRLIWLTGLSGSGKSTIATLLEKRLSDAGRAVYYLDGDNLRHGLNQDLGFCSDARAENIRRIGEVGRLFVDAGLITIAAFISPTRHDRDTIRERCEPGDFYEVFIDTPIEVCESRDPKGLYKRARAGEIAEFTGISSPYEAPLRPEVVVDTVALDVPQCVEHIVATLGLLDLA